MTTETAKPSTTQVPAHDLIIVRATYTVKKDFVAINHENIRNFITDLKKIAGIRYQVFLGDDGQTFNHLAVSESAEAQRQLLSLPSFVQFQKERDENLLGAPKLESMKFIASTF